MIYERYITQWQIQPHAHIKNVSLHDWNFCRLGKEDFFYIVLFHLSLAPFVLPLGSAFEIPYNEWNKYSLQFNFTANSSIDLLFIILENYPIKTYVIISTLQFKISFEIPIITQVNIWANTKYKNWQKTHMKNTSA